MADGVAGVRVQDHLGVADRSRGEVDQARIIAARLLATKSWGGRCCDLVVVCPSLVFCGELIDQDCEADRRAFAAYLVKFGRTFAIGDEAFYFRYLGSELNILWGEQRGAGNGDGAEFHQPQN